MLFIISERSCFVLIIIFNNLYHQDTILRVSVLMFLTQEQLYRNCHFLKTQTKIPPPYLNTLRFHRVKQFFSKHPPTAYASAQAAVPRIDFSLEMLVSSGPQ